MPKVTARSGVTVLTGRDALSRAGEHYDALLDAVDAPLTCRRPWLQAWVDSYPAWEPWVLLTDGGAAALARRRIGPLTRVLALGSGPSDETRLPAVSEDAAAVIAQGLASMLPRPWSLRIEQLPPGCLVLRALQDVMPVQETKAGDGLPRVDLTGDWRTHVSRNTRQSTNRSRRQLEATGHVLTETRTTDPETIRRALPEVMAVHRARDLALGRTPDHDVPGAADFYRAVVEAHEVELLQLRASGELAAYVLAFRDGDAFCVWDNRVSPAYQDFSAGRIANAAALKLICEDPTYSVFDWMRGEEAYKLSSATRVDPTTQFRAWSSRAVRLPYDAKARGRQLRAANPLAAKVFTALGKPPPRPL